MALVARYIGLNEILECYHEKSDTPYFSLWDKTKQICQYNGEDKEEGESILREEIDRNVRRKYSNVLMLCLHPEPADRYKPASEVTYNAAVRSFEPAANEYMPQQIAPAFYPLQQQIAALQSEVVSLKEQIEKNDDDDDEPEQISGVEKAINGINTLLSHPAVANLLTVFFTARQTTPSPANQPGSDHLRHGVRSAAGVDDDAEVLHLYAVLESKGVTLDHFRKLADMPAEKIKMLLTFL